ncbi:MAG TPA: VCBS repeat-containing protein [Roseiarcus sp.]|nr:VCBS repeat-containing protein [Roseiarcus sp.]
MTAISWNGVDGDWDLATDWSTGAVPTSADDVTFSAPGSYLVTISSADEANSLTFDAGQAALFEDAGSLTVSGALTVDSGFVSLNEANTIGSVSVGAATLAIGAAGALGTGAVTVNGGELLGTANATFANALSLSGNVTIAAANGTTLNENSSSYQLAANTILNFGAAGEGGTILWHTGAGSIINTPVGDITIQAGALEGADSRFSSLFSNSPQTTVAAGATLDLGGFNATVNNLLGAGSVTDTGAAATLTLDAADFSGTILGALSLVFGGDAALSGLEDVTGGATLNGSVRVTNAGAYDIVGNTNISGAPPTQFVNNGLVEKTGGGGVSDVTTNFVNNGAIHVLSGSIVFSGGFTNNGVIHGIVRESGGITAIGAPVPSDFTGDGLSDILWQNANGQAAIWETNGAEVTGGGSAGPNPGPGWKDIATGDFTGNGLSDILLQNANGQAAIWEMNGTSIIGGGSIASNPGPSWKAVGTGDFNGDGLSDILLQNTNGQVAVWEMNGTNVVGGGVVGASPGPSWKAIGTGDFNGDADSDILLQNASTGQVAIWEMNGNKLIGGGTVSANPGPSWKAVGTGDFYGDGHSDILFQNTSSGQVAIWEMNGLNLIAGGVVGLNSGPSWHAIGTGDYNGDGHADILFQNTSGQAAIWDMNGTRLIGGGMVGANPGPGWHLIKAS